MPQPIDHYRKGISLLARSRTTYNSGGSEVPTERYSLAAQTLASQAAAEFAAALAAAAIAGPYGDPEGPHSMAWL